MRLAVVGSRKFRDEQFLRDHLDLLDKQDHIDTVVSGGAIGADTFAERWGLDHGRQVIVHRPDWVKYPVRFHGRRAYFERNKLIVGDCDKLVAFPSSTEISPGTQSSIDLASMAGKVAIVIIREVNRIEP